MGVRGLTTYIERNRDKYLKDYKLRDSHLVIDGNSLCAQLYKYYAKCNDQFGGDYDKFAKCIETFFSILEQCNVTPIVILDGGYELKKIKTVNFRLQNKLKLIRAFNPVNDGATIFPLLHRELFKDILLKLNIPLVRCDFEADLEIACVARRLKCPVLSYDSDFFIYDTLYIPFNTLDFYATKINDGKGSNYCICCKIYNIEVFLKKCNVDKSLLPLLATLLGNDYIKKNVFSKFYNHIKLPKKTGSRSEQHRTIIALLKWLEHETFDSAVRKVLSRVKKHERCSLAQEIKKVTQGYVCTHSELFEYLKLATDTDVIEEKIMEIDAENIVSEDEDDENATEGSDSAEEDSEELEDIDLSIDSNKKIERTINSQWFKDNIRNGNFPTLFMDILSLNLGIYQPQIEDTTNIESFNIFIPLLQAICKILLKGERSFFSYLGRTENGRAKRYSYPISHLKLPKVSEIENMDIEQCKVNFMKTVYFQKNNSDKILQYPEQWQLYLLSVVYWIRTAKNPKITYCHVSSLIMCLLHLSIVNEKVPNINDKNYFINKYDKKMKNILETRKQLKNDETQNQSNNLTESIDNVNTDDCLFFIDALVNNFKLSDKIKSNKKLYSIHIVDAFAQFQSCLLHIKYLNALFKFPLPNFDIWKLYNGTYIYNMFMNLEKRNNIDEYIQLILKNSPSILKIYFQIINILKDFVEFSSATNTGRKRKRKRKKSVKEKIEETNDCIKSDSDSDTLFDHNNKFSILALTD